MPSGITGVAGERGAALYGLKSEPMLIKDGRRIAARIHDSVEPVLRAAKYSDVRSSHDGHSGIRHALNGHVKMG